MAAFDFPNSPSVNDQYTANGVTFKWNGTIWQRISASSGAQGTTGSTGPTGAQGAAAGLTISTSAPGSPSAGDMWWDSDAGLFLTYYNDGNSSQWVEINQGPKGAQGATGPTGAQGATGSTGAQGAAGAQGATGAAGSNATISNNADNRVITGGSGTNLNGEANLSFNGTNVKIGSGTPAIAVGSGLEIDSGGAATVRLEDSGSTSSFEIQNTGGVIKQNMYNNQPWTVEYNSSEKLRIDSSGRVLIGSTAKAGDSALQVYTSDQLHPAIRTNSPNANGYSMFSDAYKTNESQVNFGIAYSSASLVISNGCKVNTSSDDSYVSSQGTYSTRPTVLRLDTDGSLSFHNTSSASTTPTDNAVSLSERLRITSAGDVGIGYNSPTVKLHVREGASGASSYDNRYHMICENNGEAYLGFYVPDNSFAGIRFADTTGNEGYLDYYFNTDEMVYYSSGIHRWSTAGSERLRITSGGQLLIAGNTGWNESSSLLSIATDAAAGANMLSDSSAIYNHNNPAFIHVQNRYNTGTGQEAGIIFHSRSSYNGSWAIYGKRTSSNYKSDLIFRNRTGGSSSAERLRISSTGSVEIKSDNGNNLFILTPTASASTSIILNTWQDNSNGRNFAIRNRYSDHGRLEIMRSTSNSNDPLTATLSLDRNGNIGAPSGTNIYNASDERLKKNITTLDKGLESIKSLRPVSFNWIDGFCDDEKETLYGFIAQEVETVDSNLIETFSGGSVVVGETTIDDALRVKEKQIIPLLVKAIQELSAKVATLEGS